LGRQPARRKNARRVLRIKRTLRRYGRKTKEYPVYFEYDHHPSFSDDASFGEKGPRRFGALRRFSSPA
jgi:hypothetical protein